MHLSKAQAKAMGLLPGSVGVRINPYWPYKSKWEQDYASALDCMDPVYSWMYERVSFCLVPSSQTQKGVWYVPDFTIWKDGTIAAVHEVKGHWRPGAKHKVKSLAKMLTPVPVYAVRKVEGEWELERF